MTDAPQEREGASAWTKLRRRKVVQWTLAYVAAAWTLMEVVDHFTETYAWPPLVRQVSTLALTLGILIVIVLAWYHGDRGEQRMRAPEVVLLGTLLVLIGVAVWRYYDTLESSGAQAPQLTAGSTATSLPDTRVSLVVLPLRNVSADPDQAYFSDGLTEKLIVQLGRRALELDPFNQLFHGLNGVVLLNLRQYHAAIAEFNRVVATEPMNLIALPSLMSAHHHKQEHAQALEFLNRYAAASGYPALTRLLAPAAPDADYAATMRSAARTLAARSRTTYVLPVDVATLFALAGDRDGCMKWLERAYEMRDQNLTYLGHPDWDLLRDDPRFVDLQRRMNLPTD